MIRDLEPQSQLDLLKHSNPLLTPPHLSAIIPAYKEFFRLRHNYGLWSRPELPHQLESEQAYYDKVILLLSGVATGGKDAIREKIEQLHPNLMSKLVTATTRQLRPGENHGVDYNFYPSQEAFQTAVARDEFIEWVAQGDRLYGLPYQSLLDALKQPAPLICSHVEMSAWPKVETFLRQNSQEVNVKVLRFFVLPAVHFSDYELRLKARNDVKNRLNRTVMELETAPSHADYLVVNRIREDDQRSLTLAAHAVLHQAVHLLKPEPASLFPHTPLPRRVIRGVFVNN